MEAQTRDRVAWKFFTTAFGEPSATTPPTPTLISPASSVEVSGTPAVVTRIRRDQAKSGWTMSTAAAMKRRSSIALIMLGEQTIAIIAKTWESFVNHSL